MGIYLGTFILQAMVVLPIFVLSIYFLILTIKLARRGIKALDIYIEKNSREKI